MYRIDPLPPIANKSFCPSGPQSLAQCTQSNQTLPTRASETCLSGGQPVHPPFYSREDSTSGLASLAHMPFPASVLGSSKVLSTPRNPPKIHAKVRSSEGPSPLPHSCSEVRRTNGSGDCVGCAGGGSLDLAVTCTVEQRFGMGGMVSEGTAGRELRQCEASTDWTVTRESVFGNTIAHPCILYVYRWPETHAIACAFRPVENFRCFTHIH
jgi:hypothetical protein